MKELASGHNFRRFFNRSRVCLEIALIVLVLTIGSIDRAAPSLFNANRTRENWASRPEPELRALPRHSHALGLLDPHRSVHACAPMAGASPYGGERRSQRARNWIEVLK